MTVKAPTATVLRFGIFELDLDAGELRRAGVRVRVQKQPLQILGALLEHPGEVVSREQLRSEIWSEDTFVDFDNSLNTSINKLRDALGDTSNSPRFIETVPRRGYRFIAGVMRVGAEPPVVVAAMTSRSKGGRTILVAAVALAAVIGYSLIFHKRSISAQKFQSIAVLPLRNLSPDPQQDYFSDGMTDELITKLAKIRGLRVISHTSVEHYKQSKQTLPQIGNELGADAVVEGTILRSGNNIRITAQLIDARSDEHLWAESYERDARDVLLLQGEVAREIAEQVGVNLTAKERLRLPSEKAIDPAAHEAYLKGYFYWNTLNCGGFETALKYFQEAASRAPDFAPAQIGIADAYFNLGDWRCWPLDTLNKAEIAAQRALELDPQSGAAHDALGELAFYHSWDWTKAESEYSKAIELAPNEAGIHSDYSIFLTAMGRQEQGLTELAKSLQLDPVGEPTNMSAVYVYYLARKYDKGIEQAKKTLELFPKSNATWHWLGQCYERKGMIDEALSAYLQANSGIPEDVTDLRAAYARGGLKNFYTTQMKQRKRDKKEIDPVIEAMTYTRLGQGDRALDLLREAYRQHCDGLQFLKTEPVYDPLRNDSRFQDLVAQLRF
ncbi:MAG TPA: winged helix-turn-helix domain-containing protein [Terriglobales bacterium]|nr:winged helix-turn-helix domain-containing protein [Terriglobales bacterium]